jgi:hypothetical protein
MTARMRALAKADGLLFALGTLALLHVRKQVTWSVLRH